MRPTASRRPGVTAFAPASPLAARISWTKRSMPPPMKSTNAMSRARRASAINATARYISPFSCLDRVVDDPLPFLDLEADPFRGDEERLDFVHELGEFAVQEFAIARRDAALRLLAGVPQRVQTTLEGRARRPCGRDRSGDDSRGRRRRYL